MKTPDFMGLETKTQIPLSRWQSRIHDSRCQREEGLPPRGLRGAPSHSPAPPPSLPAHRRHTQRPRALEHFSFID